MTNKTITENKEITVGDIIRLMSQAQSIIIIDDSIQKALFHGDIFKYEKNNDWIMHKTIDRKIGMLSINDASELAIFLKAEEKKDPMTLDQLLRSQLVTDKIELYDVYGVQMYDGPNDIFLVDGELRKYGDLVVDEYKRFPSRRTIEVYVNPR